MKLLRIAAVLTLAAASTLGTATPVHAGGWATTLLDPLPDRLEPGPAYTVGYWVLQHGSHPYEGDLGKTALRMTDQSGKATSYPGAPLPEAGHYAAAVVFDHSGTWRLTAVRGVFADYEIGEVTVPGGVRVLPTPPPRAMQEHDATHWAAIRPPLAGTATATATTAAAPPPPPEGGAPILGGAALATAGLALLLGWWFRSRSSTPARPRSRTRQSP